jgi:hypothetical protein
MVTEVKRYLHSITLNMIGQENASSRRGGRMLFSFHPSMKKRAVGHSETSRGKNLGRDAQAFQNNSIIDL